MVILTVAELLQAGDVFENFGFALRYHFWAVLAETLCEWNTKIFTRKSRSKRRQWILQSRIHLVLHWGRQCLLYNALILLVARCSSTMINPLDESWVKRNFTIMKRNTITSGINVPTISIFSPLNCWLTLFFALLWDFGLTIRSMSLLLMS